MIVQIGLQIEIYFSLIACCCKCADTLVPVLLEYGANPCIKDNDGERPADKLAKSKEKQIDESSKKKLYEKLEQFSG